MLITGIPTQNILDSSQLRSGKERASKSSSESFENIMSPKNEEKEMNSSEEQSSTQINISSNPLPIDKDNYKNPNINKEVEAVSPVESKPVAQEKIISQYNNEKLNELKVENNPEQALTQRLAMKNFLLKMKQELNIAPEELINAFAKLSTEELLSPPEESLEALLQNLDLNVEEQQKARILFHQMLKQTASTSMADYLKDTNSDISINILSKKEMQDRRVQDSIQKMNEQFFVNPNTPQQANTEEEGEKKAAVATGATGAGVKSHSKEIPTQKPTVDISEMTEVSPKEAKEFEALVNSQNKTLKLNFENKTEKSISEPTTESLQEMIDSATQADAKVVQANTLAHPVEESQLQKIINQPIAEVTSKPTELNLKENASISLAGISQDENESSNEQTSSEGEGLEMGYTEVNVKESQQPQSKEFIINPRPKADEAQEAANVKEVVNQARLMIKKGGGEMKVHLSPHGLGEVTMKVNVENGKVNVEMLTDSSDAKRILEKGISELKATLASHKLNVENIKVDTSTDLLSDLSQKHREAERQFAQNFMGEFRNSNNSWRENFMGFTGARAYKSQTQDEAENPLLTAQNFKRPSRAERRLDLVA